RGCRVAAVVWRGWVRLAAPRPWTVSWGACSLSRPVSGKRCLVRLLSRHARGDEIDAAPRVENPVARLLDRALRFDSSRGHRRQCPALPGSVVARIPGGRARWDDRPVRWPPVAAWTCAALAVAAFGAALVLRSIDDEPARSAFAALRFARFSIPAPV